MSITIESSVVIATIEAVFAGKIQWKRILYLNSLSVYYSL